MKITKEVVVPNYGIEGTQGPDGKPAIYTTVTNQNIVLNAPYQGLPSDYSKANGSIQVFEGDKDVTQQATYTLKQTLNVAAELDFNKFKVTHVSTDNGMFIVTVIYKEFVSDIMVTTNVVRNGQSGQSSYIHRAWSWSSDGTDRFTTKYPNENLVLESSEALELTNANNNNSIGKDKPLNTDVYFLRGKFITISADIEAVNVRLRTSNPNTTRIGFEIGLKSPSQPNGVVHLGLWRRFSDGESFNGRINITHHVPTDVSNINYSSAYIQANGDYLKITNIKMEISPFLNSSPTIYTPSPKDDYENAYPKYEGYYSSHNPVQSTNPSDYEWTFIPHGERGPKGDKGETGPKGDKGSQGDNGQDGPPTGIIESPTIPTEVYQGMLWKNTGNLTGFITDVTYIYRGSKWEKYIFTADNIYADNLSAITANLGDVIGGSFTGSKFINNFVDVPLLYNGTSKATGQTKIEAGQITVAGKIDNEFNFVTNFTVDAMGATIYYPNSTSVMKSFSLTPNGLLLIDNQNGFNGQLLASSLTKTPWIDLPMNTGFAPSASNPPQYKIKYALDGTRDIEYRGQFVRLSGNTQIDMVAGTQYVVFSIPTSIRPNTTVTSQGSTNTGNGCKIFCNPNGNVGVVIGSTNATYVDISSLGYNKE